MSTHAVSPLSIAAAASACAARGYRSSRVAEAAPAKPKEPRPLRLLIVSPSERGSDTPLRRPAVSRCNCDTSLDAVVPRGEVRGRRKARLDKNVWIAPLAHGVVGGGARPAEPECEMSPDEDLLSARRRSAPA